MTVRPSRVINGLHGVLSGDARIIEDPVLTYSMAVVAWIKTGDSDKLARDIVSNGEGCWKLGLDIWENSLSFYCCGLHIPQADAYYLIYTQANLNDGKWHHVAGVYDGGNISIYVDGKCSKSTAATGTINARTWPVPIGANPAATGREWSGLIDDVRIYSYGLSAAEVSSLYKDTLQRNAK